MRYLSRGTPSITTAAMRRSDTLKPNHSNNLTARSEVLSRGETRSGGRLLVAPLRALSVDVHDSATSARSSGASRRRKLCSATRSVSVAILLKEGGPWSTTQGGRIGSD
jgi:hypothetical protein